MSVSSSRLNTLSTGFCSVWIATSEVTDGSAKSCVEKAGGCSQDSEKLFYIALVKQKYYHENMEFKELQYRLQFFLSF